MIRVIEIVTGKIVLKTHDKPRNMAIIFGQQADQSVFLYSVEISRDDLSSA